MKLHGEVGEDREAREIKKTVLPLQSAADLDPLLERIGDARYVLIGEASHGTHEFYAWRAALTQRLIAGKGFSFVAVEGDWPDCHAVNCSVVHARNEDPLTALERFDRWPTWMWANQDVLAFTRWLRNFNADRPAPDRVGFYGLDVYSLWESLQATLDYLREHEPENVDAALAAFRCFEPYAKDPQAYARSTRLVPTGCEDQVTTLLAELRARVSDDVVPAGDEQFNAEQNASSAAGAEEYYRTMVRGGPNSWNVRDRHMFTTLTRLMEHHGKGAKVVVWEHNTHVGDACFTSMADAGMFNVGQLVRQANADDDVVLVGFGSHRGSVLAADYWGGATKSMKLPAAAAESTEDLLHTAVGEDGLFIFRAEPPAWASNWRGHRAVGVVYDPNYEKRGNYVPTVLGQRYDAFLWIEETTALRPLKGLEAAPSDHEFEAWPEGQ